MGQPSKKSYVRKITNTPLCKLKLIIYRQVGYNTYLTPPHFKGSLYFIRGTKGISRCWIRDCRNETKLETGSLQFIQNIAVDSWNGYVQIQPRCCLIFSNIYYSTNNGDTSSTPLFPITATDVYTLSITRRLAELPPVQTLQVEGNVGHSM